MKPSIFNHFFEVDGLAILAYNSFTTALVRLDEDEFGYLRDYFEEPKKNFFENAGMLEFKAQLIKTGMIIPKKIDEIKQIRTLRSYHKQNDHHLGLTIIPTLNCNFKCRYCFSYSSKERMDKSVHKSVLEFAEEKLIGKKSLTVAWFGGEPTLCLDTIETLSSQLKSLCAKHNVKLNPGSIITNGFLMNRDVAQRLKRTGIVKAQVTLDGDRKTHDKRRPLHNGRGTFDRILNNVVETCDILKIQIRINIDRENAAQAVKVLKSLSARDLRGKVAVYFGQVKPFTEACADVATTCLSDKEFSQFNLKLTKEALIHGFSAFAYPESQIAGVCGADSKSSYIISPNGLLFKCWAEASMGASRSVGNIFTKNRTSQQQTNLLKYLDWDPLSQKQCLKCRVLPICMGGCPHLCIHHSKGSDCSTWRYNLLDTLAIRYKLQNRIASHTSDVIHSQASA